MISVLCVLFVLVGCSGLTSIPLSGGAEEGEYTLPIYVGTPAQKYEVRVTTADSVLLLPSSLAGSCAKGKNLYSQNSTTYQSIPCNTTLNCVCGKNTRECGYREIYRDLSVDTVVGNVTRDTVLFNNDNNNYTFVRFDVCPPSLSDTPTDGLFGLSRWKPHYEDAHLLSQVATMSNTADFSLCLGEFGGMLVLGGYDQQYVGDSIKYAPIITDNDTNTNFTLQLTRLTVNTTDISKDWFNTSTIIVDAGTQYLRLPDAVFDAIKSVFQQLMCASGTTVGICGSPTFFEGKCFILDDDTMKDFPDIELTLNDTVTLKIPPTNYFIDYKGQACLALERSINESTIILGNRIMQEYYTIFEPSNNRIGFAKAVNCSGAKYNISVFSGNAQKGVVGKKLASPLVVMVTRLNDSTPVQGINVTFSVVDTSVAWEVMWISHAIYMTQPARVEQSTVTTGPDGKAATVLWLAGVADETIVTADTPLCLNHVFFTALGQQSYVWRAITYFFLFLFVIVLVMLNYWYNKLARRRKLYNPAGSMSSSLLNNLDNGSPSPSPTDAPVHPDFTSKRQEINNIEEDDDDDDEFQTNRKWHQDVRRNINWYLWRVSKRLFNNQR